MGSQNATCGNILDAADLAMYFAKYFQDTYRKQREGKLNLVGNIKMKPWPFKEREKTLA